jgi:hypothetical protein
VLISPIVIVCIDLSMSIQAWQCGIRVLWFLGFLYCIKDCLDSREGVRYDRHHFSSSAYSRKHSGSIRKRLKRFTEITLQAHGGCPLELYQRSTSRHPLSSWMMQYGLHLEHALLRVYAGHTGQRGVAELTRFEAFVKLACETESARGSKGRTWSHISASGTTSRTLGACGSTRSVIYYCDLPTARSPVPVTDEPTQHDLTPLQTPHPASVSNYCSTASASKPLLEPAQQGSTTSTARRDKSVQLPRHNRPSSHNPHRSVGGAS